MDIRKFFKGTLKRKKAETSSESSDDEKKEESSLALAQAGSFRVQNTPEVAADEFVCDNDLGKWVGRTSLMTTSQKLDMLKRCWVPPENYDFSKDAKAADLQRKFNHSWLQTYSPWLVYSKHLKGALCLYCVLFPPKTVVGVLGSFVIRPFCRFKYIHEYCVKHVSSQYHKSAVTDAKHLSEKMPVDIMMNTAHQKEIETNKKILASIISSVIFCGTHDLPLRGKQNHEGILEDLLNLKIESGDQDLKQHLEHGKKNAMYTSPQIQNEIIELCGLVVKNEIIQEAKKAYAYSVMADESCDIAGKEQLSIGIRFFDEDQNIIREEFLGFVELEAMDANTIATEIDKFLESAGLESNKCVGQGYDGCSTMAGSISGVQKKIRDKYKKALYFHCASHRLNLVINDLNQVPEIRNTIGTIKDIIIFFRESALRRKYVPNIPALCETRWSHKYKSVAMFYKHFEEIIHGLENISKDGNAAARKNAYQLHCAATKSVFIICVTLIAKYSAILEPVANALQSKSIDMHTCTNHIKRIISLVKDHRQNVDTESENIIETSQGTASALGTDLQVPRIASRQQHRSNHPAQSSSDYWKRSIIIPYLDSLISALDQRFSNEHLPAFSLMSLHPNTMLSMTLSDFQENCKAFTNFYELATIEPEAELWYKLWKDKGIPNEELEKMDFTDTLKEANTFFPATKRAILILLAQPCTTANIERSFSTLRRVKTWLRSTMSENRLNGLCMLSVHRKMVEGKKGEVIEKVLNRFCEQPRKLLFK